MTNTRLQRREKWLRTRLYSLSDEGYFHYAIVRITYHGRPGTPNIIQRRIKVSRVPLYFPLCRERLKGDGLEHKKWHTFTALNKCLFHQFRFEVYCVWNSTRAAVSYRWRLILIWISLNTKFSTGSSSPDGGSSKQHFERVWGGKVPSPSLGKRLSDGEAIWLRARCCWDDCVPQSIWTWCSIKPSNIFEEILRRHKYTSNIFK
jgi:hypothetical protein